MATPTVFDSVLTNPGGTGTTITVTLSSHAVGDEIRISIGNTGNVLWAGNPAGWERINQSQVGNASNGLVGTWFRHKVVSGDTLPLANPTFTLGATVSRMAICRSIRGADLESPNVLPEWSARAFNTGTANPIRPTSITTVAPEMLILHDYFQRAATNAPEPSGYTQDEEIIISGTLVGNASNKNVADQRTALSNQDASPTSGVRWVAGILAIPSPDYVYYRSGSQALTASGTSATPALPTGTSSSDTSSRKDCIIATVEAAGTPTISPNTGADWTQIAGEWETTTSGNGTTVRKYWTLYDGSLDRQFNRSTSGEIFVYFSVYRNTDQTSPIGALEAQQNASSTTSAFPGLTRTETKSTVQATCVADATPSFTIAFPWLERNDSNGIVCADQSFNEGGTVSSDSFTLSTASPTACGLIEILSVVGVPEATDVLLATTVGAVSSVSTVTEVTKPLSLSIAAASQVSASAQVSRSFEATISGQATVASSVDRTITLQALTGSQSGLSAGVQVDRQFAAIVNSVASVQTAAVLEKYLSGEVAAQSTVSVDLSAGSNLSANIGSQSSLACDLEISKPLLGVIAGAASLQASITVQKELSASTGSQSSVNARAQIAVNLSSTINVQSATAADLETTKPLSALVAPVSAVSANTEVQKPLASTIGGQASVSVSVYVGQQPRASIDAQSFLSAAIEVAKPLQVTIVSQSAVVANLSVSTAVDLSASVSVTTSLTTEVEALKNLHSANVGLSSVSVSLTVGRHIQAAISGQSQVDTNVQTSDNLDAEIHALSSLSADIPSAINLAASITATSTVGGPVLLIDLAIYSAVLTVLDKPTVVLTVEAKPIAGIQVL